MKSKKEINQEIKRLKIQAGIKIKKGVFPREIMKSVQILEWVLE